MNKMIACCGINCDILSQLEPNSHFEVHIENTILRGSDRCTFRIMRVSE